MKEKIKIENAVKLLSKKEKIIFDNFYPKFKPYSDNNFLKEIKINFHKRSWEMYLGNVLLEKKLIIQSQNEGSDFIVNNSLYIECVAPEKGDSSKSDFVPETVFKRIDEAQDVPIESLFQDVPIDQMILRITNSINNKIKQYKGWKNKKWFNSESPFVIAINTGDFLRMDNPDMPTVIQALFGHHYTQINMKTGETSFSYRKEIKKHNNEPVPVNYFLNNDFSFLSGVLFSETRVLDHPDNIGEDCFFVNNPFAVNPVDKLFVGLFKNLF